MTQTGTHGMHVHTLTGAYAYVYMHMRMRTFLGKHRPGDG